MKTAVSWLIDHMKEYGFDLSHHEREIEQAKEMEKKQIVDAHNNGHNYYEENSLDADDYYNETFKP